MSGPILVVALLAIGLGDMHETGYPFPWEDGFTAGMVVDYGQERYADFRDDIREKTEAQRTISGPVTKIRDGDTIEVKHVPIRFQKLDCAETGTADGERATEHMVDLVWGESLTCDLTGRKSYDRWIGSCTMPNGRDLGRAMIDDGYCQAWRG